MAVNLNQKRHIVVFSVEGRECQIATDDIADIFSQQWFLAFINMGKSVTTAQIPLNIQNEYRDVAMQQQQHLQKQQGQISDLQSKLDVAIKELEKYHQPQAARPQQAPVQQQRLKNEFLSIDPSRMREDIWAGMTPQQQEEWKTAYNISG